MGHTAAVLSFMVQNTPVPIVLVGSQRSSDRPSSDAALNLIHSVRAAAYGDIAEVQICMFGPTSDRHGLLHRGTRCRKMHSSYRSTFRTVGDKRHLYGHMYDFGGPDKPLLFDIILHNPEQDSMVIATPFHRKATAFYYNQKINCLPADGRVIYGDREYLFSPAGSFGVLDWGRGVWTYNNTWYWSSASGIVDGLRFGFNFGYGFGDTSAATENMLFYDGIAHKLEDVQFHITMVNGRENFMAPWAITDNRDRVRLSFVPIIDRAADTNFILLRSDQHQIFGRFSGTVQLDTGRVLQINNLIGFAEKVHNKW